MSAKPLLCLETSTTTARVAVVDAAGAPLAAAEATAERHSANVMRLLDATLRAAGVPPEGLGAIACGAGPGSFTGLRVGLSVAKGLAMAAGPPLILVSSLDALALDIFEALGGEAEVAVPCIDAGKGEVYAGVYHRDLTALVRADHATAESWRLAPGALAARLGAWPGAVLAVAGRGAESHARVLEVALGRAPRLDVPGPSAIAGARLALLRHRRGEADDLESATPLYGRPPDITTPHAR
jgi:tRNA threonylcarbamoyladenosine biosynthesis protein TsaB